MKFQSITKNVILAAVAIILAACSTPGAAPQQTATATLDITQTMDAAHTEDAVFALTQIAGRPSPTPLPPTSTLAPSSTTIPSATMIPSLIPLPSNTPRPPTTATNTLMPFTDMPEFTPTPVNLNCSITNTIPSAGTKMDPKTEFDMKWTVKNTGTETWTVIGFDYKYMGGQKMQKFNNSYDFKADVAPGNSVDILVDMVAPASSGTYYATWAIVNGATTFCTLPASIIVD